MRTDRSTSTGIKYFFIGFNLSFIKEGASIRRLKEDEAKAKIKAKAKADAEKKAEAKAKEIGCRKINFILRGFAEKQLHKVQNVPEKNYQKFFSANALVKS